MKGLLVRVARALNQIWKRCGSVFADRFPARALRTPKEVRTALVYVLLNARRHGIPVAAPDPYSSGPWFDGWKESAPAVQRLGSASRSRRVFTRPLDRGDVVSTEIGNAPIAPARGWLLSEGWKRHGLIGVEESPRRSEHATVEVAPVFPPARSSFVHAPWTSSRERSSFDVTALRGPLERTPRP